MTAPGSKSKPACPFCRGEIAAEIALHGGNCPHCLLEVPGEEEATDPGLALAAKKDAAEAAAEQRRKVRAIAGGLAAVIVLGFFAFIGKFQWDAYQESLIYELPSYTVADLRNLPEAPTAEPPQLAVAETPPEAGKIPPRTPSTPRTPDIEGGLARVGTVVTGTTNDAPVGVAGGGIMGSSAGGASEVAPLSVGTSGTVVSTGTGSSGIALTGRKVLSDPDEIKAMVREVVDGYARGLDNCYTQALKLDEELAGTWQLTFTVGPDGKVANLGVKAMGARNADFEACLQTQGEKFKFSKMVDEFTFKKKFEFAPS